MTESHFVAEIKYAGNLATAFSGDDYIDYLLPCYSEVERNRPSVLSFCLCLHRCNSTLKLGLLNVLVIVVTFVTWVIPELN